MHNSIFNASFEESKNIVSKDILTRDGAGMGDSSSMRLRDRIILFLLFIFFFGILFYMIGVEMPISMGKSKPEDIFLISYESAQLIAKIGAILKPFVLFSLVFFLLSLTINLAPKKNYAHQLFVGSLILVGMTLCLFSSTSSLILGLTIDGVGWVGLVFQIILCAIWITYLVYDRRCFFLRQLRGEQIESKNWSKSISKFFKKYSGVFVLFIILNRWFFHLGEGEIGNPSLLGLLYGWAFLLVVGFLSFVFNLISPQFLSNFYFIKYGEQYKEYFEITDEQWYGKRKAKRLEKRRKKENQNDK